MPTTIITPIAAPIELASTSRGLANRAGKKIAWPSSIVSDAAMQTVRASRRLPRLVAAVQQTTPTQDSDLQKLINIVCAEQPSNQAVLTLTASSPDLPSGTVMHITFAATTLTIKTN